MKRMLLLGLSVALGLQAAPSMTFQKKLVQRGAIQLNVVERKMNFDNGILIYKYSENTGNHAIVNEKWGDFFLGLEFGRHCNGSWSIWDFLNIYGESGDLTLKEGAQVSMVNLQDGAMAIMKWPSGLILNMIQLKGQNDWLFMRVKHSKPINRLRLNAYPGGAQWNIKGREIHLTDGSHDYHSGIDKPLEVEFTRPGIAIYNKNFNERYGNFIVFQPEAFRKITSWGNRCVMLDFHPGKENHEFCFALGYFFDMPRREVIERFLKEQLPNIKEQLQSIDWNPQPDKKAYDSEFAIVQQLLTGTFENRQKDFEKLRRSYAEAVARNDSFAIFQVLDRLEKFRLEIGKAGLDQFR